MNKWMTHILVDDGFSALMCKGRREWEGRAQSSNQTRNIHGQHRHISPFCRNKYWTSENIPLNARYVLTAKTRTDILKTSESLMRLEVGFEYSETRYNSCLRKCTHTATTKVPQNCGFRTSIRNKFKLITMNEIWQWNGGLVKYDSKSITCVSVRQKK